MGIRKFFKKAGKALKKYALPAAGIAAGVMGAPAISAGLKGISSLWSAKDAGGSNGSWDIPGGGTSEPVGVSAQRDSAGFDWGGMAKASIPLLQGGMQMYGQSATNAANAKQAQQQMDFQAEQTGTSYQRGVADMKAAGLNPMLAYSQGGASSGGGASAVMGNEVGSAASTALQSYQTMQGINNMQAQERQINAQTANTDMDTINKGLNQPILKNTGEAGKWDAQIRMEELNRAKLGNYLTNQIMESQIASAKATAGYEQSREKSAHYGLSKDSAYSKYYQDKGKLAGGYYEPEREAVRANIHSAGKAARDIKALAVPWGY